MREPKGEVWNFPGPSSCYWDYGSQNIKEHHGLQRLPCTFCSFSAPFILSMSWRPRLIGNGTVSPPLRFSLALYLVFYHYFGHSSLWKLLSVWALDYS